MEMLRRKENESHDDYVLKVLKLLDIPVCVNTLAVLTGLAPHRLCKILNRLEMDKRIRKITNVYHAYWQPL
jgi:hypothetical protein